MMSIRVKVQRVFSVHDSFKVFDVSICSCKMQVSTTSEVSFLLEFAHKGLIRIKCIIDSKSITSKTIQCSGQFPDEVV